MDRSVLQLTSVSLPLLTFLDGKKDELVERIMAVGRSRRTPDKDVDDFIAKSCSFDEAVRGGKRKEELLPSMAAFYKETFNLEGASLCSAMSSHLHLTL